jgi:phospholipid transport system substrate-binding protein
MGTSPTEEERNMIGPAERWMLAVSIGLQICMLGLPMTATRAAAGPPTEAVRGTSEHVLRVLADPDLKHPDRAKERRARVDQILGKRFSYEEMSRRVLGAQWSRLTEGEQTEFVGLFQRLLSATYTDRIQGHGQEEIHYVKERLADGYAEVQTTVATGKTDLPVHFRMLEQSGEWLVYDVIIDGMSLVGNYRGQFARVLADSSYPGLLEKLRRKVAGL